MNLRIDQYRRARDRLLEGATSPGIIREVVTTLLTGGNYRRLTELTTQQLIGVTVWWLLHVVAEAKKGFGGNWREELLGHLSRPRPSKEERQLRLWLMGITDKTLDNLALTVDEQPDFLHSTVLASAALLSEEPFGQVTIRLVNGEGQEAAIPLTSEETLWLLKVAGAATLTLRGSRKAIIGKVLEKSLARASLRLLGLEEGRDFWLNVGRDMEVSREIDAEIETRRGRARMDVSLIGPGNQEVPEDKISRVGRNGIVLVDELGPRSQVPANAQRMGVKIIQMRNSLALVDLYDHLVPLVQATLAPPPTTVEETRVALQGLPDEVFGSAV